MTVPTSWATVTAAVPETVPDLAAIEVAPLPTAVTSPPASTVATSVSLLDHDTATPTITRPIWSRTSAAICSVCPRAVNTTVSGVTETVVGTGATTVISARPVTPDEVAEISAAPTATPVTRPESSTRATRVSLDAQLNSAPATAWPFASVASAESRSVSASSSESAGGDTVTVPTSWATVTAAVSETVPDLAVIEVAPLVTAVTSPVASTVATWALLLVHATAAPETVWPFWSRTSARNCAVAPSAVSVGVAGVTVTVVGLGGSGGVGSVPPSPHAEAQVAATSAAKR